MRTLWTHVMGWSLALLLGLPLGAAAQTYVSGSTGADGAFNPTSNTTLTLPPNGVFNFTTITIPSGVTVTFTRNAANTPVVFLATGAVTISGTIDIKGGAAAGYARPGTGGPGGFDGGAGADYPRTTQGGMGLGPGGGSFATYCHGGGAAHASAGATGSCNSSVYSGCGPSIYSAGGATYGSDTLRPIIGGSGGGGGYSDYGYAGAGGGGGGAIVIASSASITIGSPGSILADGGAGGTGRTNGGTGAGGAIRLIAPTITGTGGTLLARGGANDTGLGRIRLEAYTITLSIGGYSGGQLWPSASNAYPQPVFPPAGQPALAITSVAGVTPPATPKGTFLDPPDVVLPTGTANPVEVALAASNIPLGTVIQVTVTPQSWSRTTVNSTGLAGSVASSTATASVTLNLSQTSILTATATYPLVASAGEGPIYADGPVPRFIEGEEVTHVKVAAVFGGPSTLTYITRSGREVRVQ